LQERGAHVPQAAELNTFPADDLRRGYLVVPHDAEVVLTSLPERAGSLLNLVTNWWVERCLYGKCLVDPADDILSKPFNNRSISGELLGYVEILSFPSADVVRVLRTNDQLHFVRWHRAAPCDKSDRYYGYGNDSA